ncbi:LytR family transcriptional regulator, partial [Streptomyces sp. SID1328]|nr:LytR family transcriptional regulator [Streptomyces sp. SID1328]
MPESADDPAVSGASATGDGLARRRRRRWLRGGALGTAVLLL